MDQKQLPGCAKITTFILLFLLLVLTNQAQSQITISSFSSNAASVNTYAQVQAGVTTNSNLTVAFAMSGEDYAAGFTVKVRANDDFKNGTSTIPASYVSLKFRSASKGINGLSGGQVPLTRTDANLVNSAENLNNEHYMAQTFDLIIQGGNHLIVPLTGVYSTTVTISFYNNNGQLISSNSNIPLSFTMNFSNGCSGMVLSAASNVSYNFNTYAQLATGGTATNAIVTQYNPNGANCTGWSLKVRANGNFTNGSSSISPDHVSIKFNSVSQGSPSAAAIGVTNNPIQLSTNDVTLINPSNAPFSNYTSHTYDLVIEGGNYLSLAISGTYSCPITLSLYNQAGQLVSSSNTLISFQITYANSTNYTITLTDPDVNMQYNTPADYAAGKSIIKTKGLKVVGINAYQVIVKTLDPYLKSGTNQIPVSVVRLENMPAVAKSGISTFPINLSSADQVIIRNLMPDNTYRTIEYDLKYVISGANTNISAAAPGAYSTQVIYVVLPL
jgi:hypothetical protein